MLRTINAAAASSRGAQVSTIQRHGLGKVAEVDSATDLPGKFPSEHRQNGCRLPPCTWFGQKRSCRDKLSSAW